MLLISLAAFAVGALLASCMPLVQFALGLVIVSLAGTGVALASSGRTADMIVLCLMACGSAQMGYVAGVGASAFVRLKRLPRLDHGEAGRRAIPQLPEPF